MSIKFIVITGTSGVGKTTTAKGLIDEDPHFTMHKSYTSRIPRSNIDYQDYHFVSVPEFIDKIKNSELAEYEEVYDGAYYGTPKSGLILNSTTRILVKDVKGAKLLKKLYGSQCMLVYLQASNLDTVKERLIKDDNRDKLDERFKKMEEENSRLDLGANIVIDTTRHDTDDTVEMIYNFYNHIS